MNTVHYTIDCDSSIKPMIEKVLEHGLSELMPRIRDLDLEIEMYEFEDSEVNECGYCTREDKRHFLFEIAENQSEESMIRTILHELVHVRQYVYNELKQVHSKASGLRIYWKGVDHTNTEYVDQPWEIEAYDLEETLYKHFVSNS